MSLRLAASVAALSCPQAAAFTSRLHTPTRRLGRRALTSVRGGAAADTSAAAPAAAAAAVEDPHAWLEDVLGEKPLAWVEEQNKKTLAAIGDPLETETYKRILSILDSKDKVRLSQTILRACTWARFYPHVNKSLARNVRTCELVYNKVQMGPKGF